MNLESKELCDSIDRELKGFLGRVSDEFSRHSAAWIVDQLAEVTLNGGKRMRPLLCCWGYAAAGGKEASKIMSAAAALELLHTFAIVHDDIMDAATIRRRQPPIHKRIAALGAIKQSKPEPDHYGLSIAILVGDLALSLSDRLFMESGFKPVDLTKAWQPLSQMRQDAAAGQYLDISRSGPFKKGAAFENLDPDVASQIARLKTAGYSIRGPLLVGATLAGATDRAKQALENFGEALGEAFQLADDLQGMFGDPALTGKDQETDLRNGKPTLLLANALLKASKSENQAIQKAWGNPEATETDLGKARAAIRSSGAPEATKQRIQTLVRLAKKAIEDPTSNDLTPEPCKHLTSLADRISVQSGTFI